MAYNKESLKMFWVGLMDGDGSIQVSHWRKSTLQYRFVICLKYTPENHKMLETIRYEIGGKVYCATNNKIPVVLWVENFQKNIWKLVSILKTYPPLTTRLQMQLDFCEWARKYYTEKCTKNRVKNKTYSMESYFVERKIKYKGIEKIAELQDFKRYIYLSYFGPWVSGFIEAEGSFCLRHTGACSFSIAQKYEKGLLTACRNFFGGKNEIRVGKNKLYIWEEGKKNVLQNIILHTNKYPLLGYKDVSLKKVCAQCFSV